MRYSANIQTLATDLDKYSDLIGWIEGLRSRQYLADMLRERHAAADPSGMAKTLTPFIETALNYIEQAEKGPGRVAFLPLYYSMLNLAKVYILLGPHRGDLETDRRHRMHGAQYDPGWDDQLKLSRQKIRLHKFGVLGLFYRTVTGDPWITAPKYISMAKIYPFMDRIGTEFEMVSGAHSQTAKVIFNTRESGNGLHLSVKVDQAETPHETELRYLSGFRNDHWGSWDPNEGTGISLHWAQNIESIEDIINCCTRREMFRIPMIERRGQAGVTCTVPIQTGFPRMVEEIPIILAFFTSHRLLVTSQSSCTSNLIPDYILSSLPLGDTALSAS